MCAGEAGKAGDAGDGEGEGTGRMRRSLYQGPPAAFLAMLPAGFEASLRLDCPIHLRLQFIYRLIQAGYCNLLMMDQST